MKSVIYGVVCDGVHTDVSTTERGAKQYATRNGYTIISYRVGYNAVICAEKINNKWVKIQNHYLEINYGSINSRKKAF